MSLQPQEQGSPTLTGGLLESETEPVSFLLSLFSTVPVSITLGFLSLPPALSFLPVLLPLRELSPGWAPALLGLLLAGGRAEVVSARLTQGHSTTDVEGVCNLLSSVSSQRAFEVADQHPIPGTDCVTALGLSIT